MVVSGAVQVRDSVEHFPSISHAGAFLQMSPMLTSINDETGSSPTGPTVSPALAAEVAHDEDRALRQRSHQLLWIQK